jgi:signal peptidase
VTYMKRSYEKKIVTVVETIVTIVIVIVILLSLAKIVMFAVVEGKSMEPTLQTGDLVFVIKTSPKDLRVGDVVVYRKPSGEFVIHRIIRIVKVGNMLDVETKGDNNFIADGEIPVNWIVGKVVGIDGEVLKVPGIGYINLCLRAISVG